MKVNANTVLEFIEATAELNIANNIFNFNEPEDGTAMANQYLEQYSSCIARDIGMVDDLDELKEELEFAMGKLNYLAKVYQHYLDETDRHQECQLTELITDDNTTEVEC